MTTNEILTRAAEVLERSVTLENQTMAAELRRFDTAQREALARVEAERDKARRDASILQEWSAVYVQQRDATQAQLAEAVGLLWFIQGYLEEGQDSHVKSKIRSFISRHRLDEYAQAEQQEAPPDWAPCSPDLLRSGVCCESAPRIAGRHGIGVSHYHPEPKQEAQGAQAGDERAAFVRAFTARRRYAPSWVEEEQGFRFLTEQMSWESWQDRAALATQPAAVSDLLAVIHRDGGHYQTQHGLDKAAREAEAIVQAERDNQSTEQLWAVHAQGPDDLYAAFSKEEAETHASALNAIPCPPGIRVSAVVIESPWPAAKHWKCLVEQDREHNAAVRGAEHE